MEKMTVFDLSVALGLRQLTGFDRRRLQTEVEDILICDMLSHVLARGGPGTAWMTVQTHQNVIAVARVLDFSMIVVPDSIPVPAETVERASAVLMPVFSAQLSPYAICCQLHSLDFAAQTARKALSKPTAAAPADVEAAAPDNGKPKNGTNS